jgi:hypothetical protein
MSGADTWRRAAPIASARKEWDTVVEIRVDQLEKVVGVQATSSSTAVVQIQEQEERTTALDTRLTSLEKVCNTQSQATVLFDICAQDFE